MFKFVHDPDAVLPYTVDWSAWLGAFDAPAPTIVSHQVIADPGITVVSSSHTDTTITAVLSGGTAGKAYLVTFRAVLNIGPPYQDDRSIRLMVRER